VTYLAGLSGGFRRERRKWSGTLVQILAMPIFFANLVELLFQNRALESCISSITLYPFRWVLCFRRCFRKLYKSAAWNTWLLDSALHFIVNFNLPTCHFRRSIQDSIHWQLWSGFHRVWVNFIHHKDRKKGMVHVRGPAERKWTESTHGENQSTTTNITNYRYQ